MKKYISLIFCTFIILTSANAQVTSGKKNTVNNKQDILRGSITKERAWWDLKNYNLDIKVKPTDSTIVGSNTIRYKVLQANNRMQIDLQEPMKISKVTQDGAELKYERDGNAFFITLKKLQKINDINEVVVFFGGKPKVAVDPPWDGGISWTKDKNGKPFIASSCQGLGASVWWPNKDHLYDEVDEMTISVNIPFTMMEVSNGRLLSIDDKKDGTRTLTWKVLNPINNYDVSINIGDYVNFSEVFLGEKGYLNCNYYVLRDNVDKAIKQFKEVPRMLKAFEHWFGPYPFYEDSYKLVETPFLGMEHQSCIAYGNGYQNGYLGKDRSGSGWGSKFDYIIVHESGHEWFGNSITSKDVADLWIHESFTCYSENLFVEYYNGKIAGSEYVRGQRTEIQNTSQMIGKYNLNIEGADLYNKGANMLHTLRQMVNDDEKWRTILRGMNSTFYHQTVTTKQIEDYLSQQTGMDLKPFFNQYLRDIRIPTFEYKFQDNKFSYRWANCVAGFAIPIRVVLNDKSQWITPIAKWAVLPIPENELKIVVDKDFYVNVEESK